jgi:hypothetical protein
MPIHKTRSQNGVAAFVFTPQWSWVTYPALDLLGENSDDDPAFHGFAVEVLATLDGWKAREHDVALRAFVEGSKRYAERNDLEILNRAEEAYLDAIAWRVRAWNFRAENTAGEVVEVPPPGEAGYEAFFILPTSLRTWTVSVIREAVRPKGTIQRSSNAGPMEPSTVTVRPPAPMPPPS